MNRIKQLFFFLIFGTPNPATSPQSPGQYYFKPMMKEFRFEPSSQMITVEEGQSLRIPITGFKTAYRYIMQVHSGVQQSAQNPISTFYLILFVYLKLEIK